MDAECPRIEVVEVKTKQQAEQYLDIRQTVFVEEQGVPEEEEMDDYDGLIISLLPDQFSTRGIQGDKREEEGRGIEGDKNDEAAREIGGDKGDEEARGIGGDSGKQDGAYKERFKAIQAGANERQAVHLLALLDGKPSGAGRLILSESESSKIGRIATSNHARGQGVASAVMTKLHAAAEERGYKGCYLGAQLTAVSFYEKLGYVKREGPIFLDAGIEHIWMDFTLGKK